MSSTPDNRIAIVGMACRLPGASTVDALERALNNGTDLFTDFSPDELLLSGVTPAEIEDRAYLRTAPVLEDIAGFDAPFFGLSAEQAELMDPQHRLFFECAWQALEDAGHSPETFPGATGVFAGCSISSYLLFNLLPGLRTGASAATLLSITGNDKDYLPSHLAYLLGLTGPSVGVQTACSTSLVAVHLACQSLLSGESDLALAGGANVRVPHRVGYRYEEGSILSATGRCRSFDAAADGTVFGSGVGVVALRRYADALADGDRIHALILGSAVNNDGNRKAGYTAPSVDGQAAVIAEAMAVADVDATSIGYVEGHGTGTPIGDPIEVRALSEVFRAGGARTGSIALGSVKSLLGHLEAAAGVAGLIAATLAVKAGRIPALAHFTQANPLLEIEKTPFSLAGESRAWQGSSPRRAGVSSFGIGGTNAHLVLEQAPSANAPAASCADREFVLCVSAHDREALAENIHHYREALPKTKDLAAFCRTAAIGRRHFQYRVAVPAREALQAAEALKTAEPVRGHEQARLAMLFTGQGGWRPGTGAALASALPLVDSVIKRADTIVPGVRNSLFDHRADLADTRIAQPALYTLQWALLEQLRAWGLNPSAVAGHSSGEFAAAASAGIFDWEQGLALIAERARLMATLETEGAMAAVAATAETVSEFIAPYEADVSLAAYNTPESVVLSGDATRLRQILETLEAHGIAHRRLAVSHAFHSPLMEPILEQLEAAARGTTHRPASLMLVSTLTGAPITSLDAGHWRRHAREPVRFRQALAALASADCNIFLEIGPGAVLSGLARAQLSDAWIQPSLNGDNESHALLEAVAGLYTAGVSPDWQALMGHGAKITLPGYAFQRRRHWRQAPAHHKRAHEAGDLPGEELHSPLAKQLFNTTLTPEQPPWLNEHRVEEQCVFPGAGYAALALSQTPEAGLGSLSIERLLSVDAIGVELQTIVHESGKIEIHARTEPTASGTSGDWRRHATAEVGSGAVPDAALNMTELGTHCTRSLDPDSFYREMENAGIVLGSRFRRLLEIRIGEGQAYARLRPTTDLESSRLPLHPAVLDALFQTLGAALSGSGLPPHLPLAFDGLRLAPGVDPNQAIWTHARLRESPSGGDAIIGDLALLNADGRRLVQVDGLVCRPGGSEAQVERHLYVPVWEARQLLELPLPTAIARDISCSDDLSSYLDYLPRLDSLCGAYVTQAMERLGVNFVPGENLRFPAIAPRLERLVPRLRNMLIEDGVVDETQRVIRAPVSRADTLLSELREQFPDQARETNMLARCGAALADILRDLENPLSLLFTESPDDSAQALYAESPYASALNTMLVTALSRALPADGNARILEIGAGTGGTSRHLLPRLPAATHEYMFTDISPAFLSAAERNFGDYRFLRTGLFDAEHAPAEQNVKTGSYHLVLAANVLHATSDLGKAVTHAAECLLPGGWLVLVEGTRPSRWLDLTFALTDGWWRGSDRELRPDYPLLNETAWRDLLAAKGFDDVAILTPGEGRLAEQCVILARRAASACPATLIRGHDLHDPQPVAKVLNELLGKLERHENILVTTRGGQAVRPWEAPDPAQAAILGLIKSAALEHPEIRLRLVDLDPLDGDIETILAKEVAANDDELETAWRDGKRMALRLSRPDTKLAADAMFALRARRAGQLDSLEPEPLHLDPPGHGEIEIEVAASGLNFKDLLMALDMLPGDGRLGGECAGRVTRVGAGVQEFQVGDRVVAVTGGSLASHVIAPALRAAPMPDDLDFAQAAALPIAGFTALHALRELAELGPGQRILIHAATGGVGLYAVSLARSLGAEVLASAGSEWKRDYLRSIGITRVFDSRDAGFADSVRQSLGGEGLDAVLNSLSGEAIPAGLSLLKTGGRFVELGRVGIWSRQQVSERFPGVDYRVVSLDSIDDAEGGRLLRAALASLATGELVTPPITRLPMSKARHALALMQRAQHLGKIVLTRAAAPLFRDEHCYLITGGLGGLGLAVADWAAEQGATHLALVSRRPPGPEQASQLEALTRRGVQVRVYNHDLALASEVTHMLAKLGEEMPPLAGIFHAAGRLDNAPVEEQDANRFAGVTGAKLHAAEHLDTQCAALDFFVVFSSAAGLLGSPGQTNHSSANTALDAFAYKRRSHGKPAIVIDWGPWREIGAAAQAELQTRLAKTGMGSLSTREGLAALSWALRHDEPQVAVLPIDWPVLRRHFGSTMPALFRSLAQLDQPGHAGNQSTVKKQATPPLANKTGSAPDLAALSPASRREELSRRVEAEAKRLLALGDRALNREQPLNELGLDSLLAVELRNRLGAMVGDKLPATLLFNYPTLSALAAHLEQLMFPDADNTASPDPAPVESGEAEDEILSLSEDDLDAFLNDMESRHIEP